MTITPEDQDTVEMSGQKYRRTNFDDDEITSTGGTPPGVIYDPAIAFKVGASFWQKRSCLERLLFPVIVALSLAVVVLSILLAAKHTQLKHKEELCTSPVCVTVASTIINAIDETVDPCEDFYEYACGGWRKKHPIPSGQSRWGTFDVMWRQNQVILKNVLEEPPEKSKSQAENKAMLYYQSCMDQNKTVEKLGAAPLINMLRELGGWNMTSRAGAWDGTDWKFRDTLERLHGLVIYVLFQTWVGADEKDTTKNILQVDQPDLMLARDQYINKTVEEDKILTAYLEYMSDVSELLGADRNATREDMIKVIEFEAKLANITTPNEERRDDMKTYHKKTITDLQNMVPEINWLRYFNQLLSVTSYSVETEEKIIVLAPEYFTQMNDLIREHLSTPQGRMILHNYMMWQLVADLAPYLSEPFREAKKSFNKVLMGATGYSEEQWRYCATNTDNIVGFALGAMFVRKVFSDSKDKAEKMIEEIKTAFKNNLPQLSWMDEETRKAAREKANAVIDMIGFPPYILNSTELDKRYKGLEIKPDEYFENNIRNLHFNLKRNLNKLRKKPDKYSWNMTPPTVNAYYVPTKNEIVFPAGVLQAPFYDHRYPKSLNFGGIGVVMGHELTHGFDDVGREYDKNGILRPWWNKTVVEKFKNQTKCMVKQYSSYSINGEQIRGKQTLGENIADNGGLKAAYLAYEDWVRRNGDERLLPGTTLNHRQLFFVSFAQVWCSNSLPQTDHLAILTDEHSPAKFRVIGTLSNSNEFSEMFKCKAGSKMNPKKKCEVW